MRKRKKVLFYLPNLEGGGAERVAINIIRQLDHKEFDITLALVNQRGIYATLIPKHIVVYDLKSKKTILSIFKLRILIQQIQPDLVFSTLFRTHIALDLALTGMAKKPYLVLRSPNSPKLLLEKQQLNKIMKFFLEKAYNNASLIIAQTPEMKKEIMQYHGILESKINILINPLDTNLIDQNVRNIQNPFDRKMINVVAAGRLTKQKGFDILIKSFRDVVKVNNNFILHIIGNDGGEKQNLERMVDDFNLSMNIRFLGFQGNPYKYFYYSDLYVLSSLWEGLPNTVLENLYLKKPIVATKCIPYMSKLIENKKNGLLVETGSVEQLTMAIINYKDIEGSTANVLYTQNDINKFFSNMVIGNPESV